MTVNGDVNINMHTQGKGGGMAGINVVANSKSNFVINGDVTMKGADGGWGVYSDTETTSFAGVAGIKAASGTMGQLGATVDINGKVDLAVDGVGLYANGGTIRAEGGTIKVNTESGQNTNYAIAVVGGAVDMNMENGKAGSEDVDITGNLLLRSGIMGLGSTVNLGLNTENSVLHGVIIDEAASGSTVNMVLANGAQWINEDQNVTKNTKFQGSTVTNFAGGASADKAGYIIQRDSNNLTFDNYSGNAVVVYEHANDGSQASDYAAGDTIVSKAASGSGIVMSTSNDGITISDSSQVAKVLNALAGKLTYSEYVDGVKNLSGKVQIADGLTASSVSQVVKDITFDETTGQGGYTDGGSEPEPEIPDHQTETNFTAAITGDKETDKVYVTSGVLKDSGNYIFEKDSNITITGAGTPAIDVQGDVLVSADSSSLNLQSDGIGKVFGISQESSKKVEITAKNINITVSGTERSEGIHAVGTDSDNSSDIVLNSDITITAQGSGDKYGAYIAGNSNLTVNGDVTVKGEGDKVYGLYVETNTMPKGGTININGDIDLQINGMGAVASGSGAEVNINGGGSIVLDKTGAAENYALLAEESGNANMNMNSAGTAAGSDTVKISGNIGAQGAGTVNLGLSTNDSSFSGVIVTGSNSKDAGTGQVNLYMSNGATWVNEAYGITSGSFKGSIVANFVGGSSASNAGYIIQKDSNELTFDNYSGHAVIVYEHKNDGASASDYAAGNTVINKAAAGSGVIMSTDNVGIDMESNSAVEATLKALSEKLYYMNSQSDTNLKGQVQIADGLTASSASKQLGDITFDNNGQGSYVEGSVTPGAGGGGEIIIGDYETDIMKGARSAAMTSMLAWRDTAADINGGRTSEIRNGAEAGTWARAYGGQTQYEGSSTSIKDSYWAAQVGYDKKISGNWNVGAVIDYRDGNASYIYGGEGDNKLYSFGVYGAKDLGNGAYLDIGAKFGKVKNEYTVYNIIGSELNGDYSTYGYSLSAQYGKRIGEARTGYIEPQVQLTWAHLNGKDYSAYSGKQSMSINQNAFNSFVGRIAVQTGQESERGGLFARFSIAHEFAGDVEASYRADDGGLKSTKYDFGDTWSELTLGGSYNLSKCSNFYADVTRSLSGEYQHQWRVNAGLNFTF